MKKIAWIGLGIMGSRMLSNLIEEHHQIAVYNRTPKKDNFEQKREIRWAESPGDAVRDADVIFSMLSTPDAVKEVFHNDSGALQRMKKGSLWIDCTTVDPATSRQSASLSEAQGVRFLEAPVAGTKPHAANAELVFFVGGSKADLNEANPLLKKMGKKIMHVGEVGQSAGLKLIINQMLAQSMIVFSEALSLGEALGFDSAFLLDFLPNLVVAAPFTKMKSEMIRKGDYEVQFPLEWMHKDLRLTQDLANSVGVNNSLAKQTEQLFGEAKNAGMDRLDFAAIHKYLQEYQN